MRARRDERIGRQPIDSIAAGEDVVVGLEAVLARLELDAGRGVLECGRNLVKELELVGRGVGLVRFVPLGVDRPHAALAAAAVHEATAAGAAATAAAAGAASAGLHVRTGRRRR